MKFLLSLLLAVIGAACGAAPRTHGEFVERSVQIRGVAYRYQVFLPADKFKGKRPVVLFLHGKGELGYDGKKPIQVGLGPYLRANPDTFPAIAVFPQAPDNTQWMGDVNQIAIAALDATLNEFEADPDRIYLTGLSMGGLGTWLLAMEHPDRFAALVPVCSNLTISTSPESGVGMTVEAPASAVEMDPFLANVSKLRHIPVWIFHGGKDDLVPPIHAQRVNAALKSSGAREVHYTEFPNANHNCWDPAYAQTPELWDWLFAQHRR